MFHYRQVSALINTDLKRKDSVHVGFMVFPCCRPEYKRAVARYQSQLIHRNCLCSPVGDLAGFVN